MTNLKYPSDINKFLNYTYSGLEDSIFFNLSKIQIPTDQLDKEIKGKEVDFRIIIPDKNGDTILTVSKYFYQAMKLAPFIIVGSSNPYFTLDKTDIIPNHLHALLSHHSYHQKMLIKRVGLKIFEVVCPNICFDSIGTKLKVRIPGVIET